MAWYTKYLSIPFECNKFDMHSCDCGGLVLLVLSQEKIIDLPRLDTCVKFTAKEKHTAISEYSKYLTEVERENIQAFDVFLQMIDESVFHVGIVIDKNKILQTTIDKGVTITPLNNILMTETTFYRVKK